MLIIFFVNIGQKLANDIKNNHSLSHTPPLHTSISSKSFVLEQTDPAEIISTINSLRANATVGWDGISPTFLRRYARILAPILCYLFNLCFQTATFPTAFKKAIIHPIFKGGDGNLPNNYRPIAVLSALSKVLERLTNKRLVHYLEQFKLISPHQFGFRRNKSTSDAVHELTDNIAHNLNVKNKVLTIFLDLAKAFDTVPISTLLLKLENIGVRGVQLNFFNSYLTNRTQSVTIDSFRSDELPIHYGVPQGSILGPTLFLVFINDLCNLIIPNAKIISFADDTAITFFANSWSELQTIAQIGFNSTLNWLFSHSLTLNTAKTTFITFSISKVSQPKTPISIKAHCCSTQLQLNCQCPLLTPVDQIKYLGIILDKNLNFKSHINVLSGRIRKLIFVFKTLRHVANPKIIRNVYHALCQTLLIYCISSWGGAAKTILKPLEIAHRAILKVATFRPILFPTTELYKACSVLNVRQQFILYTVLLQHQRTPFRQITKRRKYKICDVPPVHTSFIKRFSLYLGPSLYNKINARCPVYNLSYHSCKSTIRTFLLNLDYEETEAYLTK